MCLLHALTTRRPSSSKQPQVAASWQYGCWHRLCALTMPAVACSEHISIYNAPFTVMYPKDGNPRHGPVEVQPLQTIPLTMVRLTAQDGAWSAHHDARNAKSLKNPKFAALPQFCVLHVLPLTVVLMGAWLAAEAAAPAVAVGEFCKLRRDGAAKDVGIEPRNGDEVKELVSYSIMRVTPDARPVGPYE